ncbi:ComEC/Rec2 family competence protein [Allomuricauda sp. d1]|uniref:ComEC/Rec2 family competence protein n=1 Tax=Allomuricauda sp. d1 TaxID=3136725 RepID=UPI0031E2A0E3
MPLLKFISIKLCFSLILGILLGFYFSLNLTTSIIILLVCLIALGITFKVQKREHFPFFGITALITTTVLGFVLTQLSLGNTLLNHYSKYELEQSHTWHLKITEVLKPTSFSDRYFADLISLEGKRVYGTIALQISQDSTPENLSVDDELVIYSKVEDIKPPLNPHQFDYRDYLQKKGIYHQIRIGAAQYLHIENPSRTVFGLAYEFREQLISRLRQYDFGDDELSIIQALLLGKRSDISEETYNNYRNAGAVHILAVSGLHVGILLLILQFLLKPLERLPKGRTLKLLAIIALLWSFAFVAGLSPSIIRAVTMFSFLAYALHLNRPTNTFNILALSMFFILLVKPLLLFQVGFQMSYAAVFAIVWIYPKLQRFWHPKSWPVRKVWQLLSVSLAAQLGVLPISLFYFHQFPALFFISNLVVVPFLGIVLGGGLLVLLLAMVNLLPDFLVAGYNFLIGLMNGIIEWVAQQEAFVFRNISFDGMQLLLGYLLIISLVFTLQRPKFKNLAFLLVGIIAFQGWTLFTKWNTAQSVQLILGHQTANTILMHQNGSTLTIMASQNEKANRMITNYKVGEHIKTIQQKPLQNSYRWKKASIVVLGSTGILPPKKQVDYLLLTQSSKINLERVLDSIQPKTILADGSNYQSYVARWKATCSKRKLSFHYTGEKGAYYFDVDQN